jgi:energy-converting hydrogenase Eha subunit A
MWTTKAPMPTARYSLGATAINGTLYAVGGFTSAALATLETYHPVSDTWTTKAPMPTARQVLGAAAINETLYAVGGRGSVALATLEAYHP